MVSPFLRALERFEQSTLDRAAKLAAREAERRAHLELLEAKRQEDLRIRVECGFMSTDTDVRADAQRKYDNHKARLRYQAKKPS